LLNTYVGRLLVVIFMIVIIGIIIVVTYFFILIYPPAHYNKPEPSEELSIYVIPKIYSPEYNIGVLNEQASLRYILTAAVMRQ
jgi:hypothetical protein